MPLIPNAGQTIIWTNNGSLTGNYTVGPPINSIQSAEAMKHITMKKTTIIELHSLVNELKETTQSTATYNRCNDQLIKMQDLLLKFV